MQIFRNTKSLLNKDILLKRYFATSTNPLHTQFLENKHRNAIRFENQNRIWTFEELEKHSNAFAYGLVEMGYKAGDKILLWVSSKHSAEVVGAQLGASKAGVTLVTSNANSQSELEKDLKSSDATGILYSPTTSVGNDVQYKDVVLETVPELEQLGNYGSKLKASKFPKLKWVVHTGFYTQPGQYKYRDTLVYASKNFNTLSLPKFDASIPLIVSEGKSHSIKDLQSQADKLRQENNINEESVPFIVGDARSPQALAAGALSSVLYGNYSVYTGNLESKKYQTVFDLYNGKAVKFE